LPEVHRMFIVHIKMRLVHRGRRMASANAPIEPESYDDVYLY